MRVLRKTACRARPPRCSTLLRTLPNRPQCDSEQGPKAGNSNLTTTRLSKRVLAATYARSSRAIRTRMMSLSHYASVRYDDCPKLSPSQTHSLSLIRLAGRHVSRGSGHRAASFARRDSARIPYHTMRSRPDNRFWGHVWCSTAFFGRSVEGRQQAPTSSPS